MEQAFASLQAEVQRQREQLEQQHSELTFLRAQVAALSTRPHSRPKPSLPDPEKFNGQAYRFDTWLPSIEAKLAVDGEAIGSEIAQFYYVYLNLEGAVQAMVLPQLAHAKESGVWDHQTILDQLSRVHFNPNKTREAATKLMSIKQGADSIYAYLAKFERVLYEAKGQDYPDVVKINYLFNGLSQTLKDRLSQQLNLPTTYTEYLRTVQQLASRSTTSTSAVSAHTVGHTSQHTGDKMDLSTLEIGALDVALNVVEGKPPGQTRRARSTTRKEREELRRQGKCCRCGGDGHWSDKCPLEPFRPASRSSKGS